MTTTVADGADADAAGGLRDLGRGGDAVLQVAAGMRLVRLTQLFGWGELSGEDYRHQMAETRTMLAELPDPNKLVPSTATATSW
jgi:hypothetical protein